MKAYNFIKGISGYSEKRIKNGLKNKMMEYFHIDEEVTSDCGEGRIDLIMVHKSDIDFKYPFGIEIKKIGNKKGCEIGRWFKQIIRYQEYTFGSHGKIIPFVFPQMSFFYFEEGDFVSKHDVFRHDYLGCHHNFSTFLGANGIGELQVYDYRGEKYYRLVYSSKKLWDSRSDELNVKELDFYFQKRGRCIESL